MPSAPDWRAALSSASLAGSVALRVARELAAILMARTAARCARGRRPGRIPSRAEAESPGEERAQREEEPAAPEEPAGPDGTGGAASPSGGQGGPSSSEPGPGPLQGMPGAPEGSEDALSSCGVRNAITSSYSSSLGLVFPEARWPWQLPDLAFPEARWPWLLPAAPPAEASRGGPPPSSHAADAGAAQGQKRPRRAGSPPRDSARPRKRSVCLLPRRRGRPLKLPPLPELGFQVTPEHLNREKAAALWRIHSALRGERVAVAY